MHRSVEARSKHASALQLESDDSGRLASRKAPNMHFEDRHANSRNAKRIVMALPGQAAEGAAKQPNA